MHINFPKYWCHCPSQMGDSYSRHMFGGRGKDFIPSYNPTLVIRSMLFISYFMDNLIQCTLKLNIGFREAHIKLIAFDPHKQFAQQWLATTKIACDICCNTSGSIWFLVLSGHLYLCGAWLCVNVRTDIKLFLIIKNYISLKMIQLLGSCEYQFIVKVEIPSLIKCSQ